MLWPIRLASKRLRVLPMKGVCPYHGTLTTSRGKNGTSSFMPFESPRRSGRRQGAQEIRKKEAGLFLRRRLLYRRNPVHLPPEQQREIQGHNKACWFSCALIDEVTSDRDIGFLFSVNC